MNQVPPTLDMQPDGTYRPVPQRWAVPVRTKVALGAVLIAAVCVSLLVAAVAVWFISLILPTVIIAVGVAWLVVRFRGPLFGRQRGGTIRPL